MNNLRYALRFILFAFLQTALFSPLNLGPYVCAMPYVLFLLLFPFSYSTVGLLLWSFSFGLCLDIFSGGIVGLHAASLPVVAFFRNTLLQRMIVKEDLDVLSVPGFHTLGAGKFLLLITLCTLAHHLVYFSLEGFFFFRLVGSLALNVLLIALFSRVFYD